MVSTVSNWLWAAVEPDELNNGENPEREDEREEQDLGVRRVLELPLIYPTLSQVTIALLTATHSSLR